MRIHGAKSRKIHPVRIRMAGILVFCWVVGLASWVKLDHRMAWQSTDRLYTFPRYDRDSIPRLDLTVSPDAWQKIRTKRAEAIESGILITEEADEVKAKLRHEGHSWKVKMRLKGDWVDHLQGRKWSYRIKMQAGEAWNGLTAFSLQTPESRDFLLEWLFHQLLEEVDVLTTRYTFVWLTLNGESMGIYALEEHFEKELVESRGRREGPILKWDEGRMWDLRQRQQQEGCRAEGLMWMARSADISTFGQSKVLADSTLRAQFLIGQNLLYQHKFMLADPWELFDMDRMMRYLAMVDICRAYHGLLWHNQRFYYHPIQQKLEPIGFDGATGTSFEELVKGGFLILGGGNPSPELLYLFQNKPAYALYKKYLAEYSAPEWQSAFLEKIGPQMEYWETLLDREFKGYKFNWPAYNRNLQKIQRLSLQLQHFDSFVEDPWK